MSEDLSSCGGGRDVVPIKVDKVFDSCSDRDCLRGVVVHLNEKSELPSNINVVKTKCITVNDICISIEPVPFNKGFYSIDLTYTFNVELQAYTRACDTPMTLYGTAYASKNCILYGSESNTKTFFSNGTSIGTTNSCCSTVNLPTANVSIVEPIALETKIKNTCRDSANGDTDDDAADTAQQNSRRRRVVLTLGMFSVVELTRPVTIMVPTYNYTIPKRNAAATVKLLRAKYLKKLNFLPRSFLQ